jgi:ubiquinone/menaquinone biosynthesis C-methylase UbiE
MSASLDWLGDAHLRERVPEPAELMDGAEQARAYAAADFADVNQGFVDRFRATFPELSTGRVADLGCGPADIPMRLSRALPRIEILAVDGARAMLRLGRGAVTSAALADRVRLIVGRVPGLPFSDHRFDACISNSLLHHLRRPEALWSEIRRIARHGAPLFVMDLSRPATRRAAREIVERAAGDESPILKQDFYNSLLAAFTVDEVRAQLDAAGLEDCTCAIVSERHWLAAGRVR